MWFGWVLVYFFIALLAHAVFCRMPTPGNSVIKFLGVGFPTGLGLIFQMMHCYGCDIRALSSALLYAFICEMYIFLFTFVGTSVSASLLFNSKAQLLSLDDLDKTYSSQEMVERRIQKLKEEGLLEKSGSRSILTKKGRQILGIFRALQSFFGHHSNLQMPRSSKTYS